MGFKLLIFFLCLLAFGVLLYTLLLRFSRNLGIRSANENLVRWSTEHKPALGGIGFYIAFLISVAAYFIVFNISGSELNIQLRGLIVAGTIAFLMGLADDAYNTRPLLKFATQLVCGMVLIYHEVYMDVFPFVWLNYLLTMLWVAGLMNSLNMLDNMDGITTSASIAALLSMLSVDYCFFQASSHTIFIVIGLLAILLAFLLFNKPPARMFMGDTGSQFLGVLMAGLSMLYFMQKNEHVPPGLYQIIAPVLIVLLVFIVPICDTVSVFVNRIGRGQSPFVGGKDHTTHHLFYKGYSGIQVLLLVALFSIIGNVFAFLLSVYFFQSYSWLLIGAFLYALLVFIFLYLPTRHRFEN